MYDVECVCSECGKKFVILNTTNYSYKVQVSSATKSQIPKDSIVEGASYQCSYTCNDHILLRFTRRTSHMTRENFTRYVKKSEETIALRGVVRYPIDIDKVFKNKK